jgi:prepilin-type N-terminal cleavage/methylation domain-containing protein
MTLRSSDESRRPGFTLVEMLVASALTLLIMVILTGAFQAGLDTFRKLKTAGDMQDRLRAAAVILKQDLAAEHFSESRGVYRLSDLRLDLGDPNFPPPTRGFFRIMTPEPTNAAERSEGTDGDSNGSSRATNHVLHFTVRRGGETRADIFAVPLPFQTPGPTQVSANPWASSMLGRVFPVDLQSLTPTTSTTGTFFTEWAEVAYFLTPITGETTSTGLPLHNLRRRQWVIVTRDKDPQDFTFPTGMTQAAVPEFATSLNNPYNPAAMPAPTPEFTNEEAIAEPKRRSVDGTTAFDAAQYQSAAATGAREGDDILLTDVLSFEIKVLWIPHPNKATTVPAPRPPLVNGPQTTSIDFPFDYLPKVNNPGDATALPAVPAHPLNGQRVFDTWCSRDLTAAGGTPPTDYTAWNNYGPDSTGPNTAAPTQNTVPLPIRVRALQIRLRIWDVKSQTARQVTIIQDV